MNADLIVESRKCTECLQWLHHCNAECCRGFFVYVVDASKIEKGSIITSKMILTSDLIKYYKLHNVQILHGAVRFTLSDFYIVNKKQIFAYMSCKYLTADNLCKEHATCKRANLCKLICNDNYKDLNGVQLTPNCLYVYKLRDGENGLDSRSQE